MSLSVWSNEKNCYVLAPMQKETINAFHKDFVKTYMPDFMKDFRTADANKRASMTLSKHVTEVRKTKPTHGYIAGVTKPDLEPKAFHVYAKARSKG